MTKRCSSAFWICAGSYHFFQFQLKNALRILMVSMLAHMVAQSTEAPPPSLDSFVREGMSQTKTQGLAIAVIEDGQVTQVRSWGLRNAKGEALTPDTVMYGASLTKAVFAYVVMQLSEEGTLDLDTSIATYLPKPLPEYIDNSSKNAAWQYLAGDERWRKLTPRILLTHSSGLPNFASQEPDGRLRLHFEPGTRYAYSGVGFNLLQFVLERGLGLDVESEIQHRVFDRFGMTSSSMTWRVGSAGNLADGWKVDGTVSPHQKFKSTRVAWSMDTTIADFAKFAAGYVRGDGLKPESSVSLTREHLSIATASQFPSLQAEIAPAKQHNSLAAAMGVIAFAGPQGSGFYKGGHNDFTGNLWVCLKQRLRCVVLLSNDVRAEPLFPGIVKSVLGESGLPWSWEYGTSDWTK